MQRPAPKVTVVIPCYNAARFVAEALDSVFAQSYGDYDVVLINDGSPDTAELEAALEPYAARIQYIRQENQGPGGARNRGIEWSRSEYVAFLDSDDAWTPDYLAEQIGVLTADPTIDLIYSDALLVGDSPLAGRTFMETTPSRGEVTFASLLRRECVVITSCVVARRQALIDAGLFDAEFFHSEDFDLWLRLVHRGGRITNQPRVLARHRAHGGSLTAQSGALLRAQVEICGKLLRQLDLSPSERDLLQSHQAWCSAQLRLAGGKRELAAGQYGEATRSLAEANRVLRSRKLGLSLVGLRIAPALLRRLYLLRQQGASLPPRERVAH